MQKDTQDESTTVPTPTGWGMKNLLWPVLVVAVALLVSWILYQWKETFALATPDDVSGFSDKDIIQSFRRCKGCKRCLKCLSGFTNEDPEHTEYKECLKLTNVFHCVTQLTYLYSRVKATDCCYKDGCRTCVERLDKTPFRKLEKLERLLWDEQYPDLFQSPGDKGYKIEPVTSKSGCCYTTSEEKPFTDAEKYDGKKWYPVWFNLPWARDFRYQWFRNVTCSQTSSNVGCQAVNIYVTYLMTTIEPSPDYGHTFNLLYLNHARVRFLSLPKPGYCECIH